jgi:MFS family permease
MVRRNYVYELRSAFTFPLAAALAEGSFTGVVASKYFAAGPLLIAVITAAPMFGNILALLWAQLAERRRKVPFINLLQLGVVIAVALVAATWFIPIDPATGHPHPIAGWAFALLIIVARVLASGIVTLRSAVWRLNYPRALRGQIISRITSVYNTVLSLMVLAAAWILDLAPQSYAVIYVIVALVSLAGIEQFRKVRVRGEARLLRRAGAIHPAAVETDLALGDEGGVPSYARTTRGARDEPRGALRGFVRQMMGSMRLLKTDPMFREYQWWQFLLGASFMMMMPSLIYMVSKEMTDERTQYVLAVVVVQLVPMLTGVIFLQVWAPIFDRTPLFRFRVWLGVSAIMAHALVLWGALADNLWIVATGTFMVGVAMGGGQLAWQLGQNTFATKDNVGTYMGLHVMLTGLRGMFAPFLGVGLYHALSQTLPSAGVSSVPGGRWLFLASVILCVSGTLGYLRMARRYRGITREEEETVPPPAYAVVAAKPPESTRAA